jgi:hypothetical protein
MFLLARARLLLARHRWIRWAVVALLAGGAGVSVLAATSRVDAARRQWGEGRDVWVATADLLPGDRVLAERRTAPLAVVPPDALASIPAGALAHQHVGRGEMITTADVARADWVPPGEVALSIPLDAAPALAPGAEVRVFAAGAALADGRVVAVSESAVVVAVPERVAPAVSAAAAARTAAVGALAG